MAAIGLMTIPPVYAAGSGDDNTGAQLQQKIQKLNMQQQQTQERQAINDETIQAWQLEEIAPADEGKKVEIRRRSTVDEILGKEIQSDRGNEIASVDDIIIDSGGNVQKVVLSKGGFLGLGAEKVTLDYDHVMSRHEQGDTLAAVSEATLQQAQPFATDSRTPDPNAYVMPATSISLQKVMDADVLDPQGDKVATAENIQLKNGKAKNVLLKMDATDLKVAVDFSQMQLIREDDDYHFALTRNQAERLSQIAAASEMDMESEMDWEATGETQEY